MAQRITLLTDFGTRDGYVAAMKGIIASICPTATIDDASHDLPPGDVVQAAFTLRRYWSLYPPGTVHLIVVDPGVGTERRALVTSRRYQREAQSATFHGRDVFAPVAAHVACGVALEDLGPVISDPVQLELPSPDIKASSVRGQVICVDHFGNLITNIPAALLGAAPKVAVDGRAVVLRETYGQGELGQPLALVNSDGLLEIAVRDGSAAVALRAAYGAVVEIMTEKKAGT
jgi:S-adenosylmethionine hydrolase